MSPLARPYCMDVPGSIYELAPCFAAMCDDVVVVLEDAVREPVVAHELPHILDRVQLGRPGRQFEERDVLWNIEFWRRMPACLVEQDDSVGAGIDFGADERKVLVHGMGVGIGHDQPRPLSLGRADGTEDVGPFGALILGRGRA